MLRLEGEQHHKRLRLTARPTRSLDGHAADAKSERPEQVYFECRRLRLYVRHGLIRLNSLRLIYMALSGSSRKGRDPE